jgi:sugar phosphate isomerase/epimerase
MIYISSSCVKEGRICESVARLVALGFKNIELSGGTEHYEKLENDLLGLKDRHGLNFLLHNYFPPPQKSFIANIASLDEEIYQASISHYRKAIKLSKTLNAKKFGLHAGYLIDFKAVEAGRKIGSYDLSNRADALRRMIFALDTLSETAGDEVELYLENNVLSETNRETYPGETPFLLVNRNDYEELIGMTEFNLLFDLAHFKVSQISNREGFEADCTALLSASDYIHLSGNDGRADQNKSLLSDRKLLSMLTKDNLSGKTITLEIYDGKNSINESYEYLGTLLDD